MAFTAGSVELARATRLGQKLVNYNNAFTISGTRDQGFIEKLCRNGRFTATGLTTTNVFPAPGSAFTTGTTLGVIYKTANPATGLILGGGSALYGTTAAINMINGTVS